ncbi:MULTISPECIES: OmpA family protein [unclassified Photobacterium]|uniref:OmpA family protein n=1 Tax=unclassified Photobacterium TaxID=2628852 RepID=UPI001EDD1716|nr:MULTISPECIES: OmpA family protein [unclassified Photobacterium]MCG3865445.1 OmpA family protein [Photobacterium sp. Ph6]MCG3876933.1 OmpA family protein [Photobacterium sp. Ph5]
MNTLHIFTALTLMAFSSLSVASNNSTDIQNKLISYCATPQMNITKTETIQNVTAVALNQDGYMLIAKPISDPAIYTQLLKLSQQAQLPDSCMEYLTTNGLMTIKPDNKLLARLYFKFDNSVLSDESRRIINMVIEQLKQQPNVLQLTGNTDNTGSAVYNKMLGLKRAYQTSLALQAKGIKQPKLYIQSNGEQHPIATNSTAAGRHDNRHVDITL